MARRILAGVVAVTLAALGARSMKTCEQYAVKAVVCDETVTVWEERVETYPKYVTRYDPCGKPYTAEVMLMVLRKALS